MKVKSEIRVKHQFYDKYLLQSLEDNCKGEDTEDWGARDSILLMRYM